MNIKKLIFITFALIFISQVFGDLTIKYSIYYINNTTYEGPLTTPYNFSVDVWIDNTKDNPVIRNTPYAKFVVWVEKDPNYANEYKIWTNATTNNPPYLKIWYNAKLYDENGTLLNSANGLYGDADGEAWYWGAVLKSNFGSHQTTKTPLSLPVILILLLLVIPAIVWSAMKK